MAKYTLVFLIIFSLLSNSCSVFNRNPYYVKLADKITFDAIKKIERLKYLKLIGHGGSMMSNIKVISLHFYCYHSASIGEARDLLMEVANTLVDAFNTNEEVRPYLSNYPFELSNIDISIVFAKENNTYQDPPSLSSVFTSKSKIYYYCYNKQQDRLIDFYEETCADALQKTILVDESKVCVD